MYLIKRLQDVIIFWAVGVKRNCKCIKQSCTESELTTDETADCPVLSAPNFFIKKNPTEVDAEAQKTGDNKKEKGVLRTL